MKRSLALLICLAFARPPLASAEEPGSPLASFFGGIAAAVRDQAQAQRELAAPPRAESSGDDQPGVEADQADEQLAPELQRQLVDYPNAEAPGTIVIETSERRLYLIQDADSAIRYAIGVGRDGFRWSGALRVAAKKENPDWTPPREMIERQPYLPRFMAGGLGNPLGLRALYLGGTVYRIHGTNQPQTIGQAVSSGCFRLTNPDVVDLYERVAVGAKVVIRQ